MNNEKEIKKIPALVLIYTIEYSLYTIFWILILALAKVHEISKLSLVKSFHLRFLIYYLQYFYLYFIRYRKGSAFLSFLGYKVEYNKSEDMPLFLDTLFQWLLTVFCLVPYKIYFIFYSYFNKIIWKISLIDNIIEYIKIEILQDPFSCVQLIYCAICILLFIVQTIRKNKYLTIAMLIRKIEFIKK